jgi:hypothetical protein
MSKLHVVHCSFFSVQKYFLKFSMQLVMYVIGFTVNHLYTKKLWSVCQLGRRVFNLANKLYDTIRYESERCIFTSHSQRNILGIQKNQ